MTAQAPPIPPEQQPKHGGSGKERANVTGETGSGRVPANPDEQGQPANTRQNTTHQGLQQDR